MNRIIKLLISIIMMYAISCSPGIISDISDGYGSAAIELRASVSDIAEVNVTVSEGNLSDPIQIPLTQTANGYSGTINNIPSGPGYTFTTEALDNSGTEIFSGSVSAVTIHPDQTAAVYILMQDTEGPDPIDFTPPVIDSLISSGTTAEPGDSLNLSVIAHDGNNETLSYFWEATNGSFSSPDTSSTVWTAPANPEVSEITITVTDESGNTNSIRFSIVVQSGQAHGSADITVEINTSPVISDFTCNPDQLFPDDSSSIIPGVLTTDLVLQAVDNEGDDISYEWSSSMPGTFSDSLSETTSWTIGAGVSYGNCVITVRVTDNRGGESVATKTIAYTPNPSNIDPTNQAPVVNAGNNQTITLPNNSVTLSGSATDDGLPEGSSLTYNWIEQSGPGTVTFSNSQSLDCNATFSSAGTYVLQLGASDGELTGSDTITITVNPQGGDLVERTDEVIAVGDIWNYEKGLAPMVEQWKDAGYDDSAWLSGATGIGYGDGDDTTILTDMQNGYMSVYMRKEFSHDFVALESMELIVDYDDAFVAYINGVEVARANIDGVPAYDTPALGNHDAGTPVSFDISPHISLLNSEGNVLAIQGHNRTLDSSDFSMIPQLMITGWATPRSAEINIAQGTTDIVSGSTFDYGSVIIDQTDQVTFTIQNSGDENLNLLSSPYVQISGADSSLFSINQPSSPVLPGQQRNFSIDFTPTSTGVKNATITITSNASNQGTYTYYITGNAVEQGNPGTDFIGDHTVAKESVLRSIPTEYIDAARNIFYIAYQHTSHGRQVRYGMFGLQDYKSGDDTLFGVTHNGKEPGKLGFYDRYNSALDSYSPNAQDLSQSDTGFVTQTRSFLDNSENDNVNIVMWSWCNIRNHDVDGSYLPGMQQLISEYGEGGSMIGTGPGQRPTPVTFIFMTGHANTNANIGTGQPENQANLILEYCRENNYYCLDYYNIDVHDMNDNYWRDTGDDGDSDLYGGNFYADWQDSHTLGVDWYYNRRTPGGSINCSDGHNSQHITGNRKAYALWWILARIAGWNGQ